MGAQLYAARMASGEDLADIGAALRIKTEHLRALEEGWFDELPSQAYAVGFLRSYARHLGLDAAQIVLRYKQESDHFSCDEPTTSCSLRPQPIEESRVPKVPLVMMSAFLALAGYCGWYFMEGSQVTAVETATVLPPRLAQLASSGMQPREEAVSVASAPTVEAAPVQLAELNEITVEGETRIAMVAATYHPLRSMETARASQPSALSRFSPPSLIRSAVAATEGVAANSRVTLRAKADTWILVEDAEANALRQGVLRAGEQYQAPNRDGLTLTTSNLDALDIMVDGVKVQSEGAIRRGLPLDAEQLAAL